MSFLSKPVAPHSLALFRIFLGLVLTTEVVIEWAIGHVQEVFIEPEFHFTYQWFEWVEPLPGWGMHLVQVVALLSAIGLGLGLYFRLSTFIFLLVYSYKFLLDQAWYLNHHYLVILFIFLFLLSPAGKVWSLDVSWRRKPGISAMSGYWLAIFVGMITLVYFYAGIAKINHDWLNGEPMRMWLSGGKGNLVSGEWMKAEFTALFISYGGLFFDLLIPWFLLWKRSRKIAFGVLLLFHLMNFLLFEIGIFPWTMIVASTLYFRPDWPEKWLNKLSFLRSGRESKEFGGISNPMKAFLWVFFLIQVVLPFRHFLYPGSVHWTEEGHRFSWHMILRSKQGSCYFVVKDLRSGKETGMSPLDKLHKRQYRKMAVHPDMILQFAHFIGDEMKKEGMDSIAVYARAQAGLNGRSAIPLVDPQRDLLLERRGLHHYDWVLPGPGMDVTADSE